MGMKPRNGSRRRFSSKAHLKDQLERIVDEGSGSHRSVIVQMGGGPEMKEILEIASQAARRRRMTTSARDVLPAQAFAMKRGSRSKKKLAAQKKELKLAQQSVASQMAASSVQVATRRLLREAGRSHLEPLVASDLYKRARKTAAAGENGAAEPIELWSSGSVVMELPKDELADLESIPAISDVFPNRPLWVPAITKLDELPAAVAERKTSAWGLETIGALGVWGAYESWGEGIKVAVLDTGVDASHPDLADKVAGWAEFDSYGRPVTSTPHDSDKHGTHCAGTVLGQNASGRWIGVAPAAELYAGLVLNGGRGTDASILAGMQWAIDQGVDVISMSLGGLSFDRAVTDTYTRMFLNANRLGIPVVCAIGNDGNQTSGNPGNDFFAFAVGATDVDDRAAGFSGGRTQYIDDSRYIAKKYLPLVYSKPEVSAPGVAVLSSVPGGGHEAWNGTSMATPHVAGAIALLLSATDIRNAVAPGELAYALQDLIVGSVDQLGESGQDHRYGFGRLNILRAIGYAKDRGY